MKSIYRIFIVMILFSLNSCQKYLDLKPDKKQVIPASLRDCQSLLNNVTLLSNTYPLGIEVSSDDYILTFPVWNSINQNDKEAYVWQTDANINVSNWFSPYSTILVTNQILETLGEITPTQSEQLQWNKLKGAALLLRALNFYCLAQIFAKPYDPATSGQDLGIPLKLTSSISEESNRGTVQQTYSRIVQDLTEAVALLPEGQPIDRVTRSIAMPVKAAGFAALARIYLTMGDYPNAFKNADASLKQYNVLMEFKNLDFTLDNPISPYNQEVIYNLIGSGNVPIFSGGVPETLYKSYAEGDLRRDIFYKNNGDGTYNFKGAYYTGSIFNGLATDELYLIRAECSARAGNIADAMKDVNDLLRTRWAVNSVTGKTMYVDQIAANASVALDIVIAERRKELPYRGLRWTDLRRLNKEGHFAVTLTRTLNSQIYTLPPKDPRYTLLIPREVLERVNLPQNPR
ncbi:RagB/SusD family nutrient uptake outer membrane protein [Pedobacter steynii]|uniref:SusD family protein n=1 Tax=Pedobacter steynii TaxID=430522 RepID=A0A1D7QBA4_9SPHI|nr:RagB/SusD family nutrient uptake outer membrane protein [Pedobacter steynii]AOM75951.1 hypothetical protein BFS30_01445 [Pedobacter steynii]